MVVVEGVGVVRGVKAHEGAPTVVVCKIVLVFAYGVGVPVNECGAEARFGKFEGGSIAELIGGGHIVRHLCETFATPISVGTEGARLRVFGTEGTHEFGIVARQRVVGHREEWQHAVYGIVDGEVVALSEAHLATWSGIGGSEESDVGVGVVVVVRKESLPHAIGGGRYDILVGYMELRAKEGLLG